MTKHVLIAGAGGVVGNAALRLFTAEEACRVTTISRRQPLDTFGADFVPVDLLDGEKSAAAMTKLKDITHLVFAAVFEMEEIREGWTNPLHVETNDRMLRNTLGALEKAAPDLRHVTIIHGAKAYGVHQRSTPVPTREGIDEVRSIPNFYWEQEDYVRALQQGKDWSWTILRPNYVFGFAPRSPLNLLMHLGIYAAFQKAGGQPFHFTGGSRQLSDATDSDLLARAMQWAGESPAAANEIFNITNGDLFSWHGAWPALARAYGVEPGEPKSISLEAMIPQMRAEWPKLQARYGLADGDLSGADVRGFGWLDRSLAYGFDRPLPTMYMSTIKARQAGFHDCIDSEAMFAKWIRRHQEAGVLPPPA